MKHEKQFEIELTETIAYSRPGEKFEAFCPDCKSLAEMATPQIAAILTRITEREIYRLIEAGKLHFIETERILVCLSSLNEFKDSRK